MATEDGHSLEFLLNKATNPANPTEDWEFIMAFCDQVNKELEGPQVAIRLLAHKIQSPQEKESLYALQTVEACVKNCGKRFHQEVGKFKFLNEMIKVVSPKYLGSSMTEAVKTRCIELMYSWSQGLPHETKVAEAYDMLKKQGIVTKDPIHVNLAFEAPVFPREQGTIFSDSEKSKLLSRLLKSKHPEDLQAANRLIKNMVRQDAEKTEQIAKRQQTVEMVNNNATVLTEMLAQYRAGSTTEAEKDVMRELYDSLEKERPGLFRLASDTDEGDNEAMTEILRANDTLMCVMIEYKRIMQEDSKLLADFNKSAPQPGLLDETSDGATADAQTNDRSDLDQLGDIFGAMKSYPNGSTNAMADDSMLLSSLSMPVAMPTGVPPAIPAPLVAANSNYAPLSQTTQLPAPLLPSAGGGGGQTVLPPGGMQWGSTAASTSQPLTSLTMAFSQPPTAGAPSILSSQSPSQSPATSQAGKSTTSKQNAFEQLDALGKSLLQQTLDNNKSTCALVSTSNSISTSVPTSDILGGISTTISTVTTSPSPSPLKTSSSSTSSSSSIPTSPAVVLPLNDIFVPLESIQPDTSPPLTAYEKDNLKVIIHFGSARPRPDVHVMVVLIMSTNTTTPIKNLSFQAAVPKTLRVKLQPASATDLPVFNPILPPAAITQVMLIANPQQEKVRLKFKLTYSLDSKIISDVGDVENLIASTS